jgi:hypothetical protein
MRYYPRKSSPFRIEAIISGNGRMHRTSQVPPRRAAMPSVRSGLPDGHDSYDNRRTRKRRACFLEARVVECEYVAQLPPSVRHDEHVHDAFIAGTHLDDQRDTTALASHCVKKPIELTVSTG